MTSSDYVALLAFGVSAAALFITYRFNERQKKFFENQELLNRTLLRKEDAEVKASRQAALDANFLKIGTGYRLRVFNRGKAAARHVRVEFADASSESVFIPSEVESKFPLEVMQPHGSVDLIAAVSMSSASKYSIRLLWEDDHSSSNERMVYPTI